MSNEYIGGGERVLPMLVFRRLLRSMGNERYKDIVAWLVISSGIMRGIIGASQLRVLRDAGLLDEVTGIMAVSAGVFDAMYAACGQIDIGMSIYLEDCTTESFMSDVLSEIERRSDDHWFVARKLAQKGMKKIARLNVDYLINNVMSRGPKKLDVETGKKSHLKVIALATCAETAQMRFFEPFKLQDPLLGLRATSAIPRITGGKPIQIDEEPYRGIYWDGVGACPFLNSRMIEAMQPAPTGILMLPNGQPNEKEGYLKHQVKKKMLKKYPKPVQEAFAGYDSLAVDEYNALKAKPPMPIHFLWQPAIGLFEKSKDILIGAITTAETHLKNQLRDAEIEAQRLLEQYAFDRDLVYA